MKEPGGQPVEYSYENRGVVEELGVWERDSGFSPLFLERVCVDRLAVALAELHGERVPAHQMAAMVLD